jgi:hypothetical protein
MKAPNDFEPVEWSAEEYERRAIAIADAIEAIIGPNPEWVGTLPQLRKLLNPSTKLPPGEFGLALFGDTYLGGRPSELLYGRGITFNFEAFRFRKPAKAQPLIRRAEPPPPRRGAAPLFRSCMSRAGLPPLRQSSTPGLAFFPRAADPGGEARAATAPALEALL